MASPQLENGYCSFATELIEQFCKYRLSGEEWLVLWVIFRKTYCWHKKEDKISFSQFSQITGLKRPIVARTIKKLLSKKIIGVIKKDNTNINSYRFNKDYTLWSAVIKKDTGVINNDNRVLSKKIPTIDTITKDTINNTKFSVLAIRILVTTMGMSAPDGDYKFNNIFPCKSLRRRLVVFLVSRGAKEEELTDKKLLEQLQVILNNARENTFWSKSITSISFLVRNFNKIVNLSI